METIKQAIDRADPNTLCDHLRSLKFGSVFEALPATLRKSGTAANAHVNVATRILSDQQDGQCAAAISSAYARAGTGTPANLAVAAYPPAAGQVSIAPNGKIVTNAVDAWTDVDCTYVVEKGDVVEFDIQVNPATGICVLPSSVTVPGVIKLIEATSVVGTVTGDFEVMLEGTAAANAQAELNTAKTQVTFLAGDAVSIAHLKLLVASAVDVAAALASTND